MSERTPVKAERNAAVAECRAAGMTILAISRRFHVSEARVGQILKAAGVLNARPVRVTLPAEFPSISQAAAAYGVKRDTIYRWIARGIATTGAALVLAACCGGAEAHDFYSGLRAPDGMSCCSDTMRECHTTSMCRLPDGKEGIVTSGWGCVPVPWGKVLGISSPDGQPSVCESPIHGPAPVIYCVILGGEA